jgi:hypothetical protein
MTIVSKGPLSVAKAGAMLRSCVKSNPCSRARQARALPPLAAVGLGQGRSNSARGTDDQNPFHSPEVGRIIHMATESPVFATNCLRAPDFVIFFHFPFAKSQVYLDPWNI